MNAGFWGSSIIVLNQLKAQHPGRAVIVSGDGTWSVEDRSGFWSSTSVSAWWNAVKP